MGRAAPPLHDPGNHRSIERGSNLQAARRGGLMKPAKPAGERVNTAALTPSLGTRSSKRFGKATVRKLSLSLRSRATSAAVPLALEVNRLRNELGDAAIGRLDSPRGV